MKSRMIVCAVAAAALGMGSLSFAQGYDRGYDRGDRGDHDRQGWQQRGDNRHDGERRDWQRGERRDGYNRHGGYDRGERRGDMARGGDEGQNRFSYGARGPEWHRGGRIPLEYRNRQYVVNDWRGHRLAAPPRGYEWVQVGGDYVMVAIATGIIAQLLISQ